jgi:hypothetical protein
MTDYTSSNRNIDDIPNGTIVVLGNFTDPVLIVNVNGLGKWGYSLNYGSCWFNPHQIVQNILNDYPISYKWWFKAKLKLDEFFKYKWFSNLDYIEALAKLKEYERKAA